MMIKKSVLLIIGEVTHYLMNAFITISYQYLLNRGGFRSNEAWLDDGIVS